MADRFFLKSLADAVEDCDASGIFESINGYLVSLGKPKIRSLDDITVDNSCDSFGAILGFKHNARGTFRDLLVDFGVLSVDLREFDSEFQDYVVKSVVEKSKKNKKKKQFYSFYLSDDLDESVLESNRRVFVQHPLFKKYLKEKFNINSLDDIVRDNSTKSLGKLIGFNKFGNPVAFRSCLVDFGVFSADLNDYSKEVQDYIVKGVVESVKASQKYSFYLSGDIDENVLEGNRRIVVQHPLFKKYLVEELNIKSLDDVPSEKFTSALGSVLGLKLGELNKFKDKLVDFGVFSKDLRDYDFDVQSYIVERVVRDFKDHKHCSFYVSKDISDASVLENNRKIIIQNKFFKGFIVEELNIKCLDDIFIGNSKCALGNIFGYKRESPVNFRNRLVDFGVFSADLRDYSKEVQNYIVKGVVERVKNSKKYSFYLSGDIDKAVLESNRRIVVQNKFFKDYIADELNIKSLDDVTKENFSGALYSVFGFKKGKCDDFKKRLVELGLFSYNGGFNDQH